MAKKQIIKKESDTKTSWISSDSFLKRAFSIWLHFMVAHMIFVFFVAILVFLVAAIGYWI